MAAFPSYTKTTHTKTYPAIDPTRPELSLEGQVVVITGASGGIGRATASSFASASPRALILLGRREDALAETLQMVQTRRSTITIQTHAAELCDTSRVRDVMNSVVAEHGTIDVLVHAAGSLAPVVPLLEADPATFLDGYKTTVVGTLVAIQSAVRATSGRPITFINLTTAGILFPPFPGMGAYVSSKMAAVKLLQSFAAENPQVRLHNVHPGLLETAMSAKLAESIKLPYAYDDISLPADYLVWLASTEAEFTKNKIVFASWDVTELKTREKEVIGGPMGMGELVIGYQGFPRYMQGKPLPGTQ